MIKNNFILISGFFCSFTLLAQTENYKRCISYGFQSGTNSFMQCMMQLEKEDEKESQCAIVWANAFATADPAMGVGYASAEASRAKQDCMMGRTPQRKRSITCNNAGTSTTCKEN